ncbi:MAG: DUF1990 family protein [Chloroflexota bacterium]
MDILLPGRRPNLNRWRDRPFSPGSEHGPCVSSAVDVYERVIGSESPGAPAEDGPFRRVAAAILRYDVFPRSIVTPVLAREPVQLGDLVGAVSPLGFGLRMFFVSRVIDAFDGEVEGLWRTGFTYRTLRGHPELGEETFCVEKDLATGDVKVRLSSWSEPGNWLTKTIPKRSRRLQVWGNQRALDRLERVAHGE